MEFLELIRKRRSIRKFKNVKIEEEKIDTILKVLDEIPTAGNLQSYFVYVVLNDKLIRKVISESFVKAYFDYAPLLLVFCAHPENASKYGDRGRNLFSLQDATIATTYAMLEVVEQGLGSVWVGAFYPDKVSEILNIPPKYVPVSVLPVGYPDEDPIKKERKNISELSFRID